MIESSAEHVDNQSIRGAAELVAHLLSGEFEPYTLEDVVSFNEGQSACTITSGQSRAYTVYDMHHDTYVDVVEVRGTERLWNEGDTTVDAHFLGVLLEHPHASYQVTVDLDSGDVGITIGDDITRQFDEVRYPAIRSRVLESLAMVTNSLLRLD